MLKHCPSSLYAQTLPIIIIIIIIICSNTAHYYYHHHYMLKHCPLLLSSSLYAEILPIIIIIIIIYSNTVRTTVFHSCGNTSSVLSHQFFVLNRCLEANGYYLLGGGFLCASVCVCVSVDPAAAPTGRCLGHQITAARDHATQHTTLQRCMH